MGLWLADVCASGVGDTLTIPEVLYRQAALERWDRSVPPDSPEADDSKVDLRAPVQYTAGAVVSASP
jgi:hypothetical protein